LVDVSKEAEGSLASRAVFAHGCAVLLWVHPVLEHLRVTQTIKAAAAAAEAAEHQRLASCYSNS
jgi:hypothetical protein